MENIKYKISMLLFMAISTINYAQETTVTVNNVFMDSEQIFKKIDDNTVKSFNQSAQKLFDLDDNYNYQTISNSLLNDELGYNHSKIQQFYKNLKIEYATLNIHAKDEKVTAVNGDYINFLSLNVNPVMAQSDALKLVLNYINASQYIWEDKKEYQFLLDNEGKEYTALPTAELVICRNYNNLKEVDYRLAYKFDIYALKPLSRDYVFVDANTGEIIHKEAIIKTCKDNKQHHDKVKKATIFKPTLNASFVLGTAQTRYSGTRNIETTAVNSGFELKDATRGLGIETYNLNNGTNYSAATSFNDNDNNWTAAEWHNTNRDDAALDAHWGAERTYDYFLSEHNRNSFDNNGARIKSYVHYNTNFFNAFWNGGVMTYGDGSTINGNNPLTTVDICAHEIGHAICTHTANLVYANESGAINESFSDIWGACVENFADSTKQTWIMGEDMLYPIRSLSNPNSYNQPDTYHGTHWYYGSGDYGGVHTNSGVQNFWFYLLAIGGTGTNDNGTNYTVAGIGIQNAAQIAYRTESVYLTSNSDYTAARNLSIQAANDLFGANSPEAISTQNAWCAVGLGSCINNSCPTNLIVTNLVASGTDTKQASATINASNTINTGATGIYHAGDEVLLSNGFTASSNTVFRAYIEGCSNNYTAKQVQGNTVSQPSVGKDTQVKALFEEELKVSPNPTSDKVMIKHANHIKKLSVYNLSGQLLKEVKPNSDKETEIDLIQYPPGLYIISDGKNQRKIIKK